MRKSIYIVLLSLTLAVPAFAVDGVDKIVTGSENILFKDNNPTIWQNIAVFDRGGGNYGLYMYDIDKKTFTLLANDNYSSSHRKKYSIYANKLVYESSSGIKLKDVDTLEEQVISTLGAYPSIYGEKVSYIRSGNVYLFNLLNGAESQLTTNSSIYLGQEGTGTDIYGDNLVWIEQSGSDYTLHVYGIKDGTTKKIVPLNSNIVGRGLFDLYDNYIIFAGPWELYLYNLNDDSVQLINDSNERLWYANINGGKVVWDANGQPWINMYDIKTGVRSKINISENNVYCPVTDGDKILFPFYDYGYRVIDITSPSEEIYSLNSSNNTVTVINPYDKRIVATITTSLTSNAGPSDAALSPEESYYYVYNSSEKSVAIIKTIDLTDYNVLSTVLLNPLASQTITGITGDDSGNAYLTVKRTGQAGEVWKVNQQNGRSLLQTLTGNYPSGIKISKEKDSQENDLYKLFVSDSQNGSVTVINLTDLSNSSVTTNAGSKIVRP